MQPTNKSSRRTGELCVLSLCAAAMLLLLSGCGGPPQVPRESRKLIESLRTAVSAHRTDWLEANAKLVEQKFSQGKLSEEQHEAFQSIVTLARAGNWAEAEKQTVRLGKAQHAP